MPPYRRWAIPAILLLLMACWLWTRWQPARQARRHTETLLAAVAGRDWNDVRKLIAEDYSDTWGQDKAAVLERMREVFGQFVTVELRAGEMQTEAMNVEVTVRTPVTLRGRGGPFAEQAVQRVGALREPFVFTWRRQSRRPWDWVLIRVEQPELKVES